MGMGGTYREIVPNERIVNTEQFDQAWYEGEAIGTVELTEHGAKTTVVTTMLYTSKEVRDAVLQSPMADGMSLGYDKLEELLSSLATA